MSRKGWEKLEQKLEHAGTAGNDLLNFGLVSISTFHTYSMRFVVFWVILLWRWQSPNCWIWWLVCFGWGFVVWLASQNTTSVIGSQRLANFMASNCTLMSRGGFVSTPEISSMLPANSPCLNAWEEQCMLCNMLCCTYETCHVAHVCCTYELNSTVVWPVSCIWTRISSPTFSP